MFCCRTASFASLRPANAKLRTARAGHGFAYRRTEHHLPEAEADEVNRLFRDRWAALGGNQGQAGSVDYGWAACRARRVMAGAVIS